MKLIPAARAIAAIGAASPSCRSLAARGARTRALRHEYRWRAGADRAVRATPRRPAGDRCRRDRGCAGGRAWRAREPVLATRGVPGCVRRVAIRRGQAFGYQISPDGGRPTGDADRVIEPERAAGVGLDTRQPSSSPACPSRVSSSARIERGRTGAAIFGPASPALCRSGARVFISKSEGAAAAPLDVTP
jgi:hypothetical protein